MRPADARKRLRRLIERIRTERVPDARSGVFDVHIVARGAALSLVGHTTEPAAADELIAGARRLLAASHEILDDIIRLPHPELGDALHAIARVAATPIYAEPHLPSPQISELVLGMKVDVLERHRHWARIRAEDGYIGWVHDGYLEVGAAEWALAWERGLVGIPAVSLGADLRDEEGWPLPRAPWGARLLRLAPDLHELPDGRRGRVDRGEIVDVGLLADRFPRRGESIARTARIWLGTPYRWGGITREGADCSGFTQAVFAVHGVALPRDSDMQARAGAHVEPGDDLTGLQPGDLVYFAEPQRRISHVAISLGGPEIVHSAISNGGIEINDLTGPLPLDRRLRKLFTHARRYLPAG